jgi:hypothetical protein
MFHLVLCYVGVGVVRIAGSRFKSEQAFICWAAIAMWILLTFLLASSRHPVLFCMVYLLVQTQYQLSGCAGTMHCAMQ